MIKHFETLAKDCPDGGGRDTVDTPEDVTCFICARELAAAALQDREDVTPGCECYQQGKEKAWSELETHTLDSRHGLDCRACRAILALMIRFLSTPEVS